MKNNKTKKIYIILSYTGTIPSKVVRFFSKGEFSHVSISLDKNLKNMYSFARLRPYNFLIGGFVHEKVDEGVFKRFKNTKVEIYSLEIPLKQYKKIWWNIKKMKKEKLLYKFNFLGAFGVKLKIKYSKKYHFYCAEFVKYLLDMAGIDLKLPDLVAPMDFKKTNILKLEYRGLLRKYI